MHDDLDMTRKLSALAHPARLAIVRALVKTGPEGLPAGRLGEPLDITSSALTFHLQKLAHAGLLHSWRNGQFIFYAAMFDALRDITDYLVGACCTDAEQNCGPRCSGTGNRKADFPLSLETLPPRRLSR